VAGYANAAAAGGLLREAFLAAGRPMEEAAEIQHRVEPAALHDGQPREDR
jgi:hypothetical protein